ncbi:MAG: hypothetical protein AAFX81_08435 [Pseudomonadota bacterium]
MTAKSRSDGQDASATEGMGGQGFYDSYSAIQRDTVLMQADRLRRAARALDLTGRELRVIDYGCGPGRNSMAAFRIVLEEIHGLRSDVPVVTVHSDQIGNDWNDLFANVKGPEGYLQHAGPVRPEASVGSFYDRVASPGSIDLGMSFMAAHWFDGTVRLSSPGTLFFADMTGSARQEIRAKADRDWTSFLRRRAEETRSGGYLVLETMASIENLDDPSGLAAGGHRLYRAFWRIAEGMANDGMLDPARLESFVFPLYFRESWEVRAPLEREADLQAAFEIVELVDELIPNPYARALADGGDPVAYAKTYAAFARGFSESSFRVGLFDGSAAGAAEADRLADVFFGRLEDLFTVEAGQHVFDNHSMTAVLRRR